MNVAKFNAHLNQTISEHLENVSTLAANFASRIGLVKAGELLGLLHDLGKYSSAFQNYLCSATGLINPDEDEYVDASGLKGKIDHSTAGAQLIWNYAKSKRIQDQIAAQFLALCLASHHSGLIDCLTVDGENGFGRRMSKADDKTHLEEILQKIEFEISKKVNKLLEDPQCFGDVLQKLKKIAKMENSEKAVTAQFQIGLLMRMLFSCLLDADRQDTTDSESPTNIKQRQYGEYTNWDILIDRLENRLRKFENKTKVDKLRKDISEACLRRSDNDPGIFTLTVPTGGGKTLSSLRFAMHHAQKYKLERIIYIIPFTSIIDQNASVTRAILEVKKDEKGKIVLEHHSNLIPELRNSKNKILTENWDSPIIYTTSVQFLESLFGGGTRSARRMHQLANSVIIFDEIQTLPVKTVHIFCNAINFLTCHCNSSVVLCTATQPLLNKVDEDKGKISFDKINEIMPDITSLFENLMRVEVIDRIRSQGWETEDIATLAIEQTRESGSCLIIVNTKANAQVIYEACTKKFDYPVYHLSTSMCPAHRMEKLTEIRQKLEKKEILICVSTQLIEAGVDVDFGSVIRFVAGLDSIAQAAGRCNRNGLRAIGKVFVINPTNETIDSLIDITEGKEISERILREMKQTDSGIPNEIIHPATMDRYFQYYFFRRAAEMSYPVEVGRADSLLELLSLNRHSVDEFRRINNDKHPDIYFRQAFKTAADAFKAIDAPTQGVVVPYSHKGKEIIADLFSQFAVEQQFVLLKKAQRYSVNVFPNVIKKLHEEGALMEVPEIGVLVLKAEYYHKDFGLSTEQVNEMEFLNQ